MALSSFQDFINLKNAGNWTLQYPANLPMAGAGVACPTCGLELKTNFVPLQGEQPPRYNFVCANNHSFSL